MIDMESKLAELEGALAKAKTELDGMRIELSDVKSKTVLLNWRIDGLVSSLREGLGRSLKALGDSK